MTKKVKKKKKMTGVEALLELVEAAKKLNFKGPRDLARNHDKYLYGRRPL